MKETRMTTSLDISARGIVGQEDNNNINLNDSHHNNEDFAPNIRGKSKMMKMILLTQCFAGLQLTWSVELAYGTPYLLRLGLSKSLVSLVWLAGPLSGLVMQPIVGSLSDNSTSRFGRRRPFLLAGSFAVVGSFVCIGWTREISSLFFEGESSKVVAKWMAVVSFYVLDFAINCVQASCRVLIVDNLSPSQQEEGTAWASRMIGIGNVIGYFMGFVKLVDIFPFLGDNQMQILCALASIIILSSNILTCWAVNEKVYTAESTNKSKNPLISAYETLSSISKSFLNLPTYVQQICNVQFFAWMGWFPFLFYSTTWVAEVYIRSTDDFEEPSDDTLEDSTTRIGSFSLLIYSIVSLLASLILPILVGKGAKSSSEPRKQLFQLPKTFVTVPQLWTLSHFIFAFSMLTTWFVTNTFQASILIGLCGISWTTTMWAPYSILGEFITKKSENNQLVMYNLVESETTLEGGDHLDPENGRTSNEETITELPLMDSHGGISTSDSSEAGVIFGIHNTYIVLPEFLITFFNSVVFSILEPGGHSRENLNADAIGFVLRFGGLMTVVAGFLSMKLWKNK